MFGLSKKNQIEKVQCEIVGCGCDDRKQEIVQVKVRDVKEYLVDEYERSHKLFEENEKLKEELGKTEETKLKYEAALVTLDEYHCRLEMYEKMIKTKDEEVSKAKDEKEKIREEMNDCKIQLARASITKGEIKDEIIIETKRQVVDSIMLHKGSLSKARAVEIVQETNVTIEC